MDRPNIVRQALNARTDLAGLLTDPDYVTTVVNDWCGWMVNGYRHKDEDQNPGGDVDVLRQPDDQPGDGKPQAGIVDLFRLVGTRNRIKG